MGDMDLELFNHSVENMRNLMRESPNGEYYIPETSLVEWTSAKTKLLSNLLLVLVYKFPEYQFSTHEQLHTSGIVVRWRKKF